MPPIPTFRKGAHRCRNDRYEANDPKLRLKGIWIPKRKFFQNDKTEATQDGLSQELAFRHEVETGSNPSPRRHQFWSCEPGSLSEQIVFNSKETEVGFNLIGKTIFSFAERFVAAPNHLVDSPEQIATSVFARDIAMTIHSSL